MAGNPNYGEISKQNKNFNLSTHNLLCRKFAAACWKTSTSCLLYSIIHAAAHNDDNNIFSVE